MVMADPTSVLHKMNEQTESYSIAMKGSGSYNDHSELQLELLTTGMHLLDQASGMASRNESPSGKDSRVVVEYGSSHGKNSIKPLDTILQAVTQHRITVFLNDRPENDFNSLALTLKVWQSELRRRNEQHRIFVNMQPRSFYEPLHEDRVVDLGYSFSCLHFLEDMPVYHDSPFTTRWSEETRALIRTQATFDLHRFLTLRAAEFVAGGTLVISLICPGINRPSFYESGPGKATRDALRELSIEGAIPPAVLDSCIVPVYFRTKEDVEATLASKEVGLHWKVQALQQAEVFHPLWNLYESQTTDSTWSEHQVADYAHAMITWFFTVFEGFLAKACIDQRGELQQGETVESVLEKIKQRAIKVFLLQSGSEPVFLASTFLLLERKA